MPPFEKYESGENIMIKNIDQLSNNEITTFLLPNENETRGQTALRISGNKFLSAVMAEKVKRDQLASRNIRQANNVIGNTGIRIPNTPPTPPRTEVDQPELVSDGKGGWIRKGFE